MNRAVHKISLDIHRQGTQVNLEVKKGDTARRLVVGLVEDGAPYVVDEGCYGVFMAKKSDGNTLFNACTIENGQIVYDFTEQTVSAAGRMLCEVQLYGSDDLLITSPRIAMIVSGSLLDEGVVSESESTVLGEILEELGSIRDEMDELGNLEVTVSGNAADGFVSDLEFDEIRQAHDAGQACVCLWGSWRLPLVSIADEVARFATAVDGLCYQVEIGPDEVKASCVQMRGDGSGGGSGGVYVGTEEPEDESVMVWIDPDGGTSGVDPVEKSPSMTLDVGMDADGRLYVDAYSKNSIDQALGAYIQDVDTLIGGDG